MSQQEFNEVLAATANPDDTVREQAQGLFDTMLQSEPESTALMLIEAARHGETEVIRQSGAVLFRRYNVCMTNAELSIWPRCSAEVHQAIKVNLLDALLEGQELGLVRHKICECVASLARTLCQDARESCKDEDPTPSAEMYWPEVVQALWQCAQNADHRQRESALTVFSAMPSLFGGNLQTHARNVTQLVMTGLGDSETEVQVAATKAFAAFTRVIDKNMKELFAQMVPAVLEVIVRCLVANQVDGGQMALESLIDVAEITPKMLRPVVAPILDSMVEICSNTEVDDDCRKLALEVLVSLATSAPGMVRKVPDFPQRVVPLCLQLLLDVEDDEEWTTIDKVEDVNDTENDMATAGETALDRLAIALGARTILPAAFELIPGMLTDDDWKQRSGGCFAISAIGEGCKKFMREYLDEVVQRVVPLLSDQHPRVVYAACNAVGQLAIDFAPDAPKDAVHGFQMRFHEQVLPALVAVMGMEGHPRCQAHASSALDNFCEHAGKEILGPYLQPILTRLGEMLGTDSLIVQEAAVATLATIAESAEDYFQDYYHTFMPHLKMIMQQGTDKQYRMLRARCFDCVTMMGLAVGKEMFVDDAIEIMEALRDTESTQGADDLQTPSILQSWARICQILKEDFVPFLPDVIGPVIASANMTIEPTYLAPDQALETQDNEDWEIIQINDHRIGLKCSSLEEKRTACEMLIVYSRELKGNFAPYVADVSSFMIDLMNFYMEEGVRMSAAVIQPYLLEALMENEQGGLPAAMELWQQVAPKLLKVIKEEFDWETLSFQMSALEEALGVMKQAVMTPEFLSLVTEAINLKLEDYDIRIKERMEVREKDPDYDPENEDMLTEEEQIDSDVIRYIQGTIHQLFGFAGADFLPYFDNLYKYWLAMLEPGRHYTDLQWALCVFDDIIEFCGDRSLEYADKFATPMLAAITDEHDEVRMAAAYGVGMMAAKGGEQYAEVCMAALPELFKVIEDPESRDPSNVDATENCISAVVKICSQERHNVSLAELVPNLCSWLPVTEDPEETEVVYTFCCDLIEREEPTTMAGDNLLRILAAFSQVLGKNALPIGAVVTGRAIVIIKHFLENSPEIKQKLFEMWEQDPEMQGRMTTLILGSTEAA